MSAFGGRRRRLRPPSLEWLDQSVSPWEPLSICACQACAERVEDHMARLARKGAVAAGNGLPAATERLRSFLLCK
jgi:hypothetical protein